jgi:GTPase
MFDRLEITLKAGDGGDGTVAFRRESYVPLGGPDGGDGGSGGNVILTADSGTTDFRLLRHKGIYKAGNGKRGSGKKQHGKNGEDLILIVPVGTLVMKKNNPAESIADLDADRQTVVLARGGKGGFGNAHYTSPIRQAPEIAQKGEPGEEIKVILDLRLIADVGIIGFPNVGKSSLLSVVSAANPRIADYPFTTIEPVLGVVNVGYDSFVLAEIPGLIAGAAQGKGLGHAFLHHAVRTRMFIHLINGASPAPVEDMKTVNEELRLHDPALMDKPQIVAVNKVDLPEVQDRMDEIKRAFAAEGINVFFISVSGEKGIAELIDATWQRFRALPAIQQKTEAESKVFQPIPKDAGLAISKDGDVFIVEAPLMSRMVSGTGELTPELMFYVRKRLISMGLDRMLKKAGAAPGAKVRCGYVEWDWFPT